LLLFLDLLLLLLMLLLLKIILLPLEVVVRLGLEGQEAACWAPILLRSSVRALIWGQAQVWGAWQAKRGGLQMLVWELLALTLQRLTSLDVSTTTLLMLMWGLLALMTPQVCTPPPWLAA